MSLLPAKSGRPQLKRRLSVLVFSFIVVVVVCIALLITSHTLPQKNIILIVMDTVRTDRLGCYGNSSGMTPEIDGFAYDAVLFENAFSHAPWTLPSIASLLTSTYPAQHGAGGFLGSFKILREDAVTIAEVFQRAGAVTGSVWDS